MKFPVPEAFPCKLFGMQPQQVFRIGLLRVFLEVKTSCQHGFPIGDHHLGVIKGVPRVREDRHIALEEPLLQACFVFALFAVHQNRNFKSAPTGLNKRIGNGFVLEFAGTDKNLLLSAGNRIKNRPTRSALRRKPNLCINGNRLRIGSLNRESRQEGGGKKRRLFHSTSPKNRKDPRDIKGGFLID